MAALIVMLLLLPSAALAEETPVTAAEIAGTWSGDALKQEDPSGGSPATVPLSMTIAEDGTGTVAFSAVTVLVSYADGIISGSIKRGTWSNSFNAMVSRNAGEIINVGEYVIILNDKSAPLVYSWTGSREDGTAARTEETVEEDIPVLIEPTPTTGATPAPTPSSSSWWPYQPEWTPIPKEEPSPCFSTLITLFGCNSKSQNMDIG